MSVPRSHGGIYEFFLIYLLMRQTCRCNCLHRFFQSRPIHAATILAGVLASHPMQDIVLDIMSTPPIRLKPLLRYATGFHGKFI